MMRTGPILWALALVMSLASPVEASDRPIKIGLDLEIGDVSSTSDEAIRFGAQQAVAEINARGGVLNGRPLEVVALDNRSVPARGVENLRQFARDAEVVAVMTGKFSPVVLEQVKELPALQLSLLDPWAAADKIVGNGQTPNWVFRLSMSDSMAVEAVLRQVRRRGFERLGVLLPNTGWGRSNHEALKAMAPQLGVRMVGVEWYNWGGDKTLMERYVSLRQAGAQAIFLVANEREGADFVRVVADFPKAQRLPVVSHWGVTGGDFATMCGEALRSIDFVVVQTYSFVRSRNARARSLAAAARREFGVDQDEGIPSPVGVAHAYDLVHLLANALEKAGTTDRAAVRAALESLGAYDGVVKRFAKPFTETRHEALVPGDLFFARYGANGSLLPISMR